MKKELAIYTQDFGYAYNFRNKFHDSEWSVEYLTTEDSVYDYINSNNAGVVFIDFSSGYSSSLDACIKDHMGNYVFALLDENNSIDKECYANTDIVLTNLDKIRIDMNTICRLYNKKILAKNRVVGEKLYNSISEALLSFGLSPKRIGYRYLQECLEKCLNINKSFICFKSDIYPYIAKQYNVSMSAIEKAIRMSIKEAFMKFPELFNNEFIKLGHPTNNQFMNFLKERIK